MADRFARATGNWADTSTWSATASGSVGASVPGASDSAIINVANKVGGAGALTITLTGDVEVDGLELYGTSGNDATLHTASEHTVTINNYGIGGYSAKIHGYTELTGNVNLTFTKAGAHTIIIDPTHQTNKVNDITVNHASNVLKCGSNVDIKGDLTVTAGTYNTNSAADGSGTDYNLTVAGTVTLGDGDLLLNASAVTIGGFSVTGDGEMTGTTHANGLIVLGNWRSAGSRFNNADGKVVFKGSSGGTIAMNGAGGTGEGFYDVEINIAGQTYSINEWDLVGIERNLTITAGTFSTSGSNYALTVEGDVSVTGTLTGNASAIEIDSLTIAAAGTYSAPNASGSTTIKGENTSGYCIDVADGGTFTHNSGKVVIDIDTNSVIRGMEGDDISGTGANAFNDLDILTNSVNSFVNFDALNGTTNTIKGDLTIKEGSFFTNGVGDSLIVEGDVSVESGGWLGRGNTNLHSSYHSINTGANTFGSLTIASGGTYSATSGTTTLKSETSGGSTYVNDGTFTHNNGTLLLHADIPDTQVYAGSSSLYNVTSSTGNNVWLKENITIANDLTITSGTFGSGGGNDKEVTVHGNVFISGGEFGNGSETGAYTVKGLVTLTGGTFDLSSGTINLGGIRNAGGTIS